MHYFCSFSTKIYLHNGIIGGIIFPFCESCFRSTMANHVATQRQLEAKSTNCCLNNAEYIVLADYMMGLTNQIKKNSRAHET